MLKKPKETIQISIGCSNMKGRKTLKICSSQLYTIFIYLFISAPKDKSLFAHVMSFILRADINNVSPSVFTQSTSQPKNNKL